MSEEQKTAEETVAYMMRRDAFSRWLNVALVSLKPDHCTLRMTVRPEMCNGFQVCHGGVSFSLADSALAFASNSDGRLAMSVENSMVYPAKVVAGDILTAVAKPLSVGYKLATYDVTITTQEGTVVGIFRGTVYRTSRDVIPKD